MPTDPGAWSKNRGPGLGQTSAPLGTPCAYLSGGPSDRGHHNAVAMFDGYLAMPWAHESGGGGLTLFEVDPPCNPRRVGSAESATMRETHTIGFSQLGGQWAVVNQMSSERSGGVQFWNLTDPTRPLPVADFHVERFHYPDAYAQVTLNVFWQVPYLYVAGGGQRRVRDRRRGSEGPDRGGPNRF